MDCLGRLVIPKEITRKHNFNDRQELEIYVDDDSIVLKKYSQRCVICADSDELLVFGGKNICCVCISRIGQISMKEVVHTGSGYAS